MPKPRNVHELKRLQGKLAYLRRFISNLAGKYQPFNKLMKKGLALSIAYPGKEVSIPVCQRRYFRQMLLRCLSSTEAAQSVAEAHVGEVYHSGAYLMSCSEGKQVGPINGGYLKRYYP
ncbi:hypothetical protein LIER_01320 [Lithospermum erythrorhizon]|uniref:Uncharacterized protein n=1 Tax=Lithospermum erythrorhizon TaxID=34254 RepID=A0AAV3NLI7_LITER